MKVTDVEFRHINKGTLKAVAKVTFDDSLIINGFKIIKGSKGDFISWPQQQGSDSKWYEMVFPTDKDIRYAVNNRIMDLYKGFDNTEETPEEKEEEQEESMGSDDDLPF